MNPVRVILATMFLAALAAGAEPKPVGKPNVIIILSDDLGYGSLGCYGNSDLKTPNVDRLAREGIRFTDAYAPTSVCTPTRYALMTGEYAWRGPVGPNVFGNVGQIIASDQLTLPRIFQQAGYATAGFGKWNLGLGPGGCSASTDFGKPLAPGPRALGFDYFFGIPVMPVFPPSVYFENEHLWNADPKDPLIEAVKSGPGQRPVYKGAKAAQFKPEMVTTELTGRICEFIEQNKDRPFFIYYPMTNPHEPFTPHPRFRRDGPWGLYGAYIEEMDWSIGEIMEALEKSRIADNTLLIFTSDNGGIASQDGNLKDCHIDPNGQLLGCKGGLYEGGIRIPLVLRWPGVAPAAMVSNQPLQLNDFLATFAALLGQPLGPKDGSDSFDLLAAFRGETGLFPERPLIFQGRGGFFAVRRGDWKYIATNGNGDLAGPGDHTEEGPTQNCQLFHLTQDLSEKENLCLQKPDQARKWKALLENARSAPTRREQ